MLIRYNRFLNNVLNRFSLMMSTALNYSQLFKLGNKNYQKFFCDYTTLITQKINKEKHKISYY